MRNGLFLMITLGIFAAYPALAAIEFQNETYQSGLFSDSETIDEESESASDFSLEDVSFEDVKEAKGWLSKIGNFFVGVDGWLKEKAGIDFFGILKTLGAWFVVVVEWMLKGIKSLIEKI